MNPAIRLLAVLLAASFIAGCGSRRQLPLVAAPGPAVVPKSLSAKPDVYKYLTGAWWRAKGMHVEGLMLFVDGRLDLLQVAPLRGSTWKLEGRRVVLRMYDRKTDDLYEDELYIRRLTDRTLVMEAADSHFSGTYKRRRDDVAPPNPGFHPTPLPQGDALERVLDLMPKSREQVPQREAWRMRIDEFGECAQVLNTNLCPRFYTDAAASLLLIEICQGEGGFGPGIHLLNGQGGVASYPWFDDGFGRFLCDNACDTPDACYYQVTSVDTGGRPTELVYYFDIGLTYGELRYRLGRDGDIRLLDKRIGEAPPADR